MKALIFNSGLGSRLGTLTENNPKCMIKLYNGETILERQIRLLSQFGIKDFIITTGPFEEQMIEVSKKFENLDFTFVKNPEYLTTNYIVSMDCAYDYLEDDILLLHGDLVFNRNLISKILGNDAESVCLYNEEKKLPDKDFKGRFSGAKLTEVSVNIFDDDCFAFQPLYRLSKRAVTIWKTKVREMVKEGITGVYAENALNEISGELNITGMSYKDDYIDEIDNEEDYKRVSCEIRFFDGRDQITEIGDYEKNLEKYINKDKSTFLVCGKNMRDKVKGRLKNVLGEYVVFSDFTPNPKVEDIIKGVEIFKKSNCKTIVAVGGGSTIDVAKCIKLFSGAEDLNAFPDCKYLYSDVKLIAVPTTAGTGSEADTFAAIYKDGEKESIDHGMILPDAVLLDYRFLKDLPDYHKKSSMLDALSQSIESFWAAHATKESREYAAKSINAILDNYEAYFRGEDKAMKEIMLASNESGRAINISKTTAPHAMSYKLTTTYGISHGHAVALCLIPCFRLLAFYGTKDEKLNSMLMELALTCCCDSIEETINKIKEITEEAKLPQLHIPEEDVSMLSDSVNVERLNNNPVIFTKSELAELYGKVRSGLI